MKIDFIDLGLQKFEKVQEIQEYFLAKRKKSLCENIILCSQFYPVITLGRNAKEEDILIGRERLKREGIALYRVNRGGGVTLHLPGQWVIYPILDLKGLRKDIGFYLEFLQKWIVIFLSLFKIEGKAENPPGVWVKGKKICFLGIGISRWVTFHGLSININPDLKPFQYINPCGIKDLKVTSLKEELLYLPPAEEIKENLLKALDTLFRKEGFLYAEISFSTLVSQTLL
ncbi:MAG: lipoyl(octanoyl) transferase LipB [Candidatus Omnitrophica bacterium]|nr:lipoyl(octanoyl) transferase LipB [Candidatus Omnitrophota bacterium]MCM8793645.1 lipoyl(octanoyl) transferase LipB [Candidatus Omnitrophota bacterium]